MVELSFIMFASTASCTAQVQYLYRCSPGGGCRLVVYSHLPPTIPASTPASAPAPTAAPGEQDVTGDDDDGAATATAPTIAATTTEEVEVQIVAEEGAGAEGDADADDDEATNSSTPGGIIDDVIVDEIASASGHVKALLDAKDARGRTPLHLAVLLGHDKVAHLLVDAGASVKARDAEVPLYTCST